MSFPRNSDLILFVVLSYKISFRKDSGYNPTMTFYVKRSFAEGSDLALILWYNSNMLVLGISLRHYFNYSPSGPFNLQLDQNSFQDGNLQLDQNFVPG